MDRRRFLIGAGLFGVAALSFSLPAEARPVRRAVRRQRRRVRRRVRRRFRRRVTWRVVAGRRLLVVPVAMAVGWELMIDGAPHVVVAVEKQGDHEVVKLTDSAGVQRTESIVREDTAENAVELEGSVLPEGDESTPGREDTIEVDA